MDRERERIVMSDKKLVLTKSFGEIMLRPASNGSTARDKLTAVLWACRQAGFVSVSQSQAVDIGEWLALPLYKGKTPKASLSSMAQREAINKTPLFVNADGTLTINAAGLAAGKANYDRLVSDASKKRFAEYVIAKVAADKAAADKAAADKAAAAGDKKK